jgi:hypothetical protein
VPAALSEQRLHVTIERTDEVLDFCGPEAAFAVDRVAVLEPDRDACRRRRVPGRYDRRSRFFEGDRRVVCPHVCCVPYHLCMKFWANRTNALNALFVCLFHGDQSIDRMSRYIDLID